MGTRKLAAKLLLIAVLLTVGSRMLTEPENYMHEGKTALNHTFPEHTSSSDLVFGIRVYGSAVILTTILLLLKFEQMGCVLLVILSLASGLINNPFFNSSESVYQKSLFNLGLISALLMLLDETWAKLELDIRRFKAKIFSN